MIGYLQGTVLAIGDTGLTVLCGEVGYELAVPQRVRAQAVVGERLHVWTHLAVREQGWELYGFGDRESRDLFRFVQKVPKVGAKTALAMLDVFRPAELLAAVVNEDVRTLTGVPGIGKRTAELIVVELRDRIDQVPTSSGAGGDASPSDAAVQALAGLGYALGEARDGVRRAIKSGIEAGDVETIIRFVLTEQA